MTFNNRIILIFGLVILLSLGHSESFCAETEVADTGGSVRTVFEPVHWAYSSFFGTGWYQKKDARSVFVLRIPPRQILRKSSISDSGERKLGVEIKYPLTVGLHDVEDLGGIIENDNFGTVTFAPGVELEIPINKQWYLRTFAHIGWGKELQVGESAWIYYTGIKSQYEFPSKSQYKWYLLNSLYYAGYTPDKGRSDHLSVAEIGVEFLQPLNKASLAGRPIDLHWKLMYSFLGNEIHFNLPDGSFEPVEDQMEIALQTSFRDGPLKIWFLNVHRLGIGYRFSSSGEFSAITLSMRSWFTN
jgi:hypothetical protein